MRRWLRNLMIAVLGLAALVTIAGFVLLSLPPFGGELSGDRLARARANPIYRDGEFVNPLPPAESSLGYLWTMVKGQFLGREVRRPPHGIPVMAVDAAALKTIPPASGLRAFWLGHASVFIEIDGQRLLVDPIFSDYASPFDVGPKRFHPPPIALGDLPPIDGVLITHDHYDHLDMRTIQHLAQAGARFFVPLGIGAHLERWGVPTAQVFDFEWGQLETLGAVRVIATPSRHYSGRGLTDGNATLWTSWAILGPKHRVYISGDTGYSDHFALIGAGYGPFDLSFIKIGAYGPGAPWLDIHMSAEDASGRMAT